MAKTVAVPVRDAVAGKGRWAAFALIAVLLAAIVVWQRSPVPAVAMPLDKTGMRLDEALGHWPSQPLPDAVVASAVRLADERDAAPVAAISTVLRREFETSPDLFAYAQRLAPQVRRGEADALWLLSKVIDYCGGFANDRRGFARDSVVMEGLRVPPSMLRARARIAQRCSRFSDADGLTQAALWQLRSRAAEAGSVAAETALAVKGEPGPQDAGAQADLVKRVVDSRDPDAYSAMSSAVANGNIDASDSRIQTTLAKVTISADGSGASAGDAATMSASSPPGLNSSSIPQLDALAWQLAACKLGGECGATGSLMTAYCVNGGICSQRADQDFETFVYDAAVPRQGAAVLKRMVDALVDDTGEPE